MEEKIETKPEEMTQEQPRVDCLSKMKLHKLKILGGFLGILALAGAIFGAYKLGQKQTQPSIFKKCQTCSGPQDSSCPGNHTCVVPTGSSQGVCLPVPKPGQRYTVSQINQECGTNFPEVQPTPTSDPTANWKTYKGKNFIMKYPNDWNLREGKYLNAIFFENKNGAVSLGISEGQYPYGFEGDMTAENKPIAVNVGDKEYQTKETIVENKAVFVDFGIDNPYDHHILFGTGYPTGSASKASLPDYYQEKEIILKMLSTFKFLALIEATSGMEEWKTFIGNKVQFKYPPSWKPSRGELGRGTVYDNIVFGIPNLDPTGDQSLGFSSVTLEDLTKNKSSDIAQEATISIDGKQGIEWLRKGDNYTAYDFYTAGFQEAGTFGIHVVVGKEGNEALYKQLKTLITTIKFNQ